MNHKGEPEESKKRKWRVEEEPSLKEDHDSVKGKQKRAGNRGSPSEYYPGDQKHKQHGAGPEHVLKHANEVWSISEERVSNSYGIRIKRSAEEYFRAGKIPIRN